MYHSLTIGRLEIVNGVSSIVGKNTWDDWHLIPSSRPFVAMPEVNANAVDIPFRDGSLDITEAVTGFVTYKDRDGSWEFYIHNDYSYWANLLREIANYLHGKRFAVWLEDEPEYYYEGRLSLEDYKPGKNYSTLSIHYVLHPYKLSLRTTADSYVWDTFNFETGYAIDLQAVDIPATIDLYGGRMRTGMIITTTDAGATVSLNNGESVALSQGVNHLEDLIPLEGHNTLTFTGTGSVTVQYREGSL